MKNTKLKKKIGEKNYNFLTRNFNDDIVADVLPQLFLQISDVREIVDEDLDKLKKEINKRLETKEEKKEEVTKTVAELLAEKGYKIDTTIRNKSDYLKYEKNYRQGEKLCKFDSYDATSRYGKLFYIYKDNYTEINPEENPKRMDNYSTSLLSVAVSKDKRNIAQICSRYNHKVGACDNIFNSNLDNINEGLTEAFNKEYNFSIKKNETVEFENFYLYNGKLIYYYLEKRGKKIGNNTVDGFLYDKNRYIFLDYFMIDINKRKIENITGEDDAFTDVIQESLNNGAKINIFKTKKSLEKLKDDDNINIIVEK